MHFYSGLFASVDRGITRYNILQSIRALQSCFKNSSPSSSSPHEFSHFTTLQPHMAFSNAGAHRIHPGTLLETCSKPITSAPSPSPSTTSSNRLRTLFANLPRSLNKHLLPNYQQSRSMKHQNGSNDYVEVKSNQNDQNFVIKSDCSGVFVPVCTNISMTNSGSQSHFSTRSSSSSSNRIQGLYTTRLLSKLIDQYPLILELIVSRTLEENVPTAVGYPFRRITLHRLIENHARIIAFDMKNYAFIEIDTADSSDMYAIEHDNTLFQRYQAQLRWCNKHLAAFSSQAKTIVHSSNGTAMFIQATPFQGQQMQQYHQQRRNSSSIIASPLAKHMPQTIFTSQESISATRSRSQTPASSKFYTTSNHSKLADKQKQKGKTIGSSGTARKDVRTYFNDPTIQKHLQNEHMFHNKHYSLALNSTTSESINGDEENDNSFQCTAL